MCGGFCKNFWIKAEHFQLFRCISWLFLCVMWGLTITLWVDTRLCTGFWGVHTLIPPWDLSLVLNASSRTPFEPIDSSDLKLLLLKTTLLLALSTAKRVSALHALSFGHEEAWLNSLCLVCVLRCDETEPKCSGIVISYLSRGLILIVNLFLASACPTG